MELGSGSGIVTVSYTSDKKAHHDPVR